ncbi:General stress protein 69 [Aquimixticola soesokkakensis]|uniref:General stress protein 69 n=1 Tax=Aquimixticola soesokkakensis TaxID=1519096 RepID=A0A1Y5SEW0_9RHOB|nr:aldo/keto reductase [Aquimixticola soesokkakensis]SLN37550.1 General stress protein 69 [Aquimixticola soesokkakensis]
MRRRTLGKTDISVSELCLGTMTWGTQNTLEEGHAQIERALEAGINFMDTAEMYPVNPVKVETAGRTEEIIGDYFKRSGKRNEWVLATKIAGPGPVRKEGITAASLPVAVEASLKRLQTEVIDLYQFHWPNRGSYHFRQNWGFAPDKQDVNAVSDNMFEVAEAMKALVKSGKIRAFGTSNESAWGMARWAEVLRETDAPAMQTIQNEYSLMCRLYDLDLAEASHHLDFTLLAYSPLATGMLTGKYKGGTVTPAKSRLEVGDGKLGGRVTPNAWAASQAYVEIAQKHGLNPTKMAVAWTLDRPFDCLPIIGATSVAQLDEILGAEDLVLSKEVKSDIAKVHKQFPLPY